MEYFGTDECTLLCVILDFVSNTSMIRVDTSPTIWNRQAEDHVSSLLSFSQLEILPVVTINLFFVHLNRSQAYIKLSFQYYSISFFKITYWALKIELCLKNCAKFTKLSHAWQSSLVYKIKPGLKNLTGSKDQARIKKSRAQ